MVNVELARSCLQDHSVLHTAVAMSAYKVLSHYTQMPSDVEPNVRTV